MQRNGAQSNNVPFETLSATGEKKLVRILDGSDELVAFRYIETEVQQGQKRYEVLPGKLSTLAWFDITDQNDTRDLNHQIELTNGTRVAFASMCGWYVPQKNMLVCKHFGLYRDCSPTGPIWRLRRWLGNKVPTAELQRRPFSWRHISRKRIRASLRSSESIDIHCGLMDLCAGYLKRNDISWAAEILSQFLDHWDGLVSAEAANGLGELARVYGWRDVALEERLKLIANLEVPWLVKRAVDKALREIEMFGGKVATIW